MVWGMSEPTTFEMLARYHIEGNLERGLRYVQGGVMRLSEGPVEVGRENGQQWYRSAFTVSNHGSALIEALINAGCITETITPLGVKSESEFVGLIDDGEDGALVYDRSAGMVTRAVLERGNSHPYNRPLGEILPPNFLSEDGSVPLFDRRGLPRVGSRTRMAFNMSRGVPDITPGSELDFDGKRYISIDACLIKYTAYNELGFGPVVHIARDTLDMFFFRYDPESSGPFVNEDHGIIGVYRPYRLEGGRFVQTGEVSPVVLEGGRLVDGSGNAVLDAHAGSRATDSPGERAYVLGDSPRVPIDTLVDLV